MEIEYRLPIVIHIDITKYDTICRKKMWQWCKTTYGKDDTIWSWDHNHHQIDVFFFKNEKHANMFVLKWA